MHTALVKFGAPNQSWGSSVSWHCHAIDWFKLDQSVFDINSADEDVLCMYSVFEFMAPADGRHKRVFLSWIYQVARYIILLQYYYY